MALSERELLITSVANALTIYAIRRSEDAIPLRTTPHQFVMDTVPQPFRERLTADIIDEVFAALNRSDT